MTDRRHLDWDGCCNARDLGGLPAGDGRETRWGAVVRADSVDRLTASGWAALEGHGVRTVIDLRNDDELGRDAAQRPAAIATVHLPLDGVEDREFWDHWERQAPPLFYGPHLDRFPERAARVVAAVGRAQPGGVVVHCVGGRDRTGLVTMLLLALAGVAPEVIAADHALSDERLAVRYARLGEEDQGALIADLLRRRGTSAREVMLATLASLDVETTLRAGGLADDDLAAVRARLVQA